jgi:hypothetical protein
MDEDTVIRAEAARGDVPGSRWAGRALMRLPGRSRTAIQVRASTLRITQRMQAEQVEQAQRIAPAPSSRIVPSGAGLPDFLAAMPEFNRRW